MLVTLLLPPQTILQSTYSRITTNESRSSGERAVASVSACTAASSKSHP